MWFIFKAMPTNDSDHVSYITKELKNISVLSLKVYCIHSYVCGP